MIYFFIIACLLVSSCSLRSTYPTLGAIAGGGVGSLGGPGGAALGAGTGAIAGEALKNKDALMEAEETITQLTTGDVEGLIQNQMGEHQGAFDSFVSTIKRILIIAACLLGAYLSIPIFVARKTAESCSKKHLTRPPFPTNEKL
jgi:hypothetical protein